MSTTGEPDHRDKLTNAEAKDLTEMYRNIFEAYGQFVETLGTIQQTHREAYETMSSPATAARLPEMLSELSVQQPELNQLFTRILIKLSTYTPMLNNMMNLSAVDKIQLGRNLKSLASDFDELLGWAEKVRET